jgi:hypothetical protein
MQRLIALSFTLLLGPVMLTAQSPTPGTASPSNPDHTYAYAVQKQPLAGCPVSMHAEQRAMGTSILVTRDGERHPAPKQIRLTLGMTLGGTENMPSVTAAKVTVWGFNGKPGMLPITTLQATTGGPHRDGPEESTRSLDLSFARADDGSAQTDMDLPGFVAVSSIRIDSLTYSDGSTWTAPSVNGCRTAPDPFMLVSAR